ncbi:MAG: RlpA-like double-psi beta-barrel domain-containing protein [Solirubrobacterales bacterium]
MHEGEYRRFAEDHNSRGDRPSRVQGRPDRVALWAVFLAIGATVVAAASAQAQAGSGGTPIGGECEKVPFGDRSLQLGDCGDDVKTLNWFLNSTTYADGVDFGDEFGDPTDVAVRELQDRAGLAANGVVDGDTREELRAGMKRKTASWYGPGFWRNQTACGQKLRRKTVGVAHKRLPCGTKVVFNKGGRWVRAKVIDRGPFVKGRSWDLTQAAARALGMEYTESVRSAVIEK